jgi:hypothetical protein
VGVSSSGGVGVGSLGPQDVSVSGEQISSAQSRHNKNDLKYDFFIIKASSHLVDVFATVYHKMKQKSNLLFEKYGQKK